MTVGWLEIDGVEVANELRTLTYLRRGLAGSRFTVTLAPSQISEGSGLSDILTDIFEADAFTEANLACYCVDIDDGPYVSPASDSPWYDGSDASADFLGFIPSSVNTLPNTSRSLVPRELYGTAISRPRFAGRVVAVTGTLYAASRAGIAFGEAWIRRRLSNLCEQCEKPDLRYMPYCGTTRTLRSVALIDGPVFSEINALGGCSIEEVSFQIASTSPVAELEPVSCLAEEPLVAGETYCCIVAAGPERGDTAARITIRAGLDGQPVTDVVITATPTTGSCPTALTDETITYTLDTLDIGTEIIIDAALRSIVVRDAITHEPVGGLDALTFNDLFSWIETCDGQDLCVCVDATSAAVNPTSTVLVESIRREV